MGDMPTELTSSPFYGPGGLLAGALVFAGMKYLSLKMEWPEKINIPNVLVALCMLSGYIYLWTQGNPHDGELKENGDLYTDVPLFVLGGYYASDLYPYKGGLKSLFNLSSVCWIMSLMINGSGSNIGVVFGTMIECQVLATTTLRLLQLFEFHECLIMVVKYLTVPFYVGTRLVGAGYTIMKLAEKEDVPIQVKGLGGMAFAISMLLVVEFIDMIRGCEEEENKGKGRSARSRSKSQTRSNSKSRSRSRTPRRRR